MRVAKKNILIFSTAYLPFVGGAEVSVDEITKRLKEYDFDLITARLDRSMPYVEKINNVTVYRVGTGNVRWDKILLPIRAALCAWKLTQKKDYLAFWGVMVTYATGAAYIVNMFRKLFGKRKIPIILNLQEGDSEFHLQFKWAGLISLSWRLALKQTEIVTGLSNFLLHRARRYGYKGKSLLVPNGVDVKLFSKKISKQNLSLIRDELQTKEEDVYLITTSRLSHKNAIDDVLKALKELPSHIKFIIIGTGEEKIKLQKLAYDLELSKDRVKFLGYMPHVKIPEYLDVSSIFIRPSRSEGFGNSFIEAMVARVPVIATPVGGIVDFIDDKETGIFCCPDNPKSIVESVQFLLQDSEARNHIIENAFTRATERYNWDSVAFMMKSEVFEKLA